jgi:hypothetical protein
VHKYGALYTLLDSLITSKTRIKLLLKFFLNTNTKAYLRSLADEFGDSTNSIRVELKRLKKAGLLTSTSDGRTKVYFANKRHPLFTDIHKIILKFIGIDQLIDIVLSNLGTLEFAFVTGDYAKGIDSGIIDIVLVGEIDRLYFQSLIEKVEKLINRKIRSLIINTDELDKLKKILKIEDSLIVWNNERENIFLR